MARKPKKGRVRGVVRSVFNPRQWMSYDSVKESGEEVSQILKDFTTPKKGTRKETFEQAVQRLNLTEDDIQARMKSLLLTSWLYFGVGAALLLYGLIGLFVGKLLTFLIAVVISLIAFVLAFRDSFHYFQMKKRKLGCTIREWIQFITRGS